MTEIPVYSQALTAALETIRNEGNPTEFFGAIEPEKESIIPALEPRTGPNDDLAELAAACGRTYKEGVVNLVSFAQASGKDLPAASIALVAALYFTEEDQGQERQVMEAVMRDQGDLARYSLKDIAARSLRLMSWFQSQPDFKSKGGNLKKYYDEAMTAGKIPEGDIDRVNIEWEDRPAEFTVKPREEENSLMAVEKIDKGIVVKPVNDKFPMQFSEGEINYSVVDVVMPLKNSLEVRGYRRSSNETVPYQIELTPSDEYWSSPDEFTQNIQAIDLEKLTAEFLGMGTWERYRAEWGGGKSRIIFSQKTFNEREVIFALQQQGRQWILEIHNSNFGVNPTDTFNRLCQFASVMINAALGFAPPLEAIKAIRPPLAIVEPEQAQADEKSVRNSRPIIGGQW